MEEEEPLFPLSLRTQKSNKPRRRRLTCSFTHGWMERVSLAISLRGDFMDIPGSGGKRRAESFLTLFSRLKNDDMIRDSGRGVLFKGPPPPPSSENLFMAQNPFRRREERQRERRGGRGNFVPPLSFKDGICFYGDPCQLTNLWARLCPLPQDAPTGLTFPA